MHRWVSAGGAFGWLHWRPRNLPPLLAAAVLHRTSRLTSLCPLPPPSAPPADACDAKAANSKGKATVAPETVTSPSGASLCCDCQ